MNDLLLLHAVTRAENLPSESEMKIVDSAGLAALCGSAPRDLHAADADWLQAAVLRHDSVIRSAFSRGTVLPVRFGTVMDRAALRDLLAQNQAALAETLE